MVDAMCERYHTLPTHILSQATTLDMVIFDVAMTYRHHLRQKKDPKATPNMPQEQLEEIMRKHKQKYDKS